ncbi:hypothetical protein RclHR1_04280004 [Rhizophagus clarus]|uniref:Uncharacterized protein n=1 Tax=Rhizophagus clarus TaxID=94130 RepID=A0A2Z6SAA4_9GLOM|nr:hypothetical protein RclHR1_04280004 [Rhizophagus clarus]GES85926.1 hypothetical protein GLOIN_2v1548496 [Rhizophagus clarus]
MEYEIKNVNDLKKKCEMALKVISKCDDVTSNNFSIKKEKLCDIIELWQNSYPELHNELERWKSGFEFPHETVALICNNKRKKIMCVFLKIYELEGTDFLNCVNVYRNYPKPSKISKVRNIIFKHKSEKFFNQLIKSHSETMAALILSENDGNDGLKISWN